MQSKEERLKELASKLEATANDFLAEISDYGYKKTFSYYGIKEAAVDQDKEYICEKIYGVTDMAQRVKDLIEDVEAANKRKDEFDFKRETEQM